MTNKTYIVVGAPFLNADGSKTPVGKEIQLAEDVADLHRARLRPKKQAVVKHPAKKSPDVKSDD
jgi:hypothetical protein